MIRKLFKKEPTALDKELDGIYQELVEYNYDTEEYGQLLKRVEEIKKIQGLDRNLGVSPDTLLIVSANLVGILIILNYERAGIITSKAFGTILKGRV